MDIVQGYLIPVLGALQRWRFIWLNLLFMAYLWLAQPAVMQRMMASSQAEHPDWLMGGLLVGLQGLEVIGLLLKRPVSAFYAWHNPDTGDNGGWQDNLKVALFVFIPILHICFTAILTVVVFEMLKMNARNGATAAWQCLSLLLFFVVLFKEAFFAGLILSIGVGASGRGLASVQPQQPRWAERLNRWLAPPVPAQLTLKEMAQDLAGDLLLLAFSMLAYTAGWEFITASSPVRGQGSELLAEYLGVSLFFFMTYFTTRSVYLMQELSIRQSRTARTFSWVSFLAVWISALWFMPVR